MSSRLKSLLKPLVRTPLHPQWMVRLARNALIEFLATAPPASVVLDIGCFDMWPRRYLPPRCRYVGLDYLETAEQWYGSRPDVFADAADIPVRDESVDLVLLLSVLEHLVDPERVLVQIRRSLRPNGRFVMQVPFLYPLHDEPRDFARWTRHGIEKLAERTGYTVERCVAVGSPLETAALLANLAGSKTALNWIEQKSPLALLALALPVVVLIRNLVATVFTKVSKPDDLMPLVYQAVLKKQD